MTHSITSHRGFAHTSFDPRILIAAVVLILFGSVFAFSQVSVSPENTVIVDDAADMEVFSYGKTVVVKKQAKGVLAFGGDVIVEGTVYGDVATVGGSVIQKEGAYIGGDVIILGGKYKPQDSNPLREAGRETVMYAGYEEELRAMSQNPSSLFAPNFSLAFVAQRILSVLFWFIVSLGLATIAPGAVSRAVARFQISTLKIVAIGVAAFLVTTIGVIASLKVLPNYLGAIFGLMAFFLLMLAYVFGRVALNVSVGKILQKRFLGDNRSETSAILIGVIAWTLLLSIPYVWTLALFVLFAAGSGLVLTARSQSDWLSR
ncbi:MAG TPA: polymer-forming cytoskeletal protein [Pyrinomonadaceae bacterium]